MKRVISAAAIAALGALLSGCSGLHADRPPVQIYVLRATAVKAEDVAQPPAIPATIQVPRVSADPGLGTQSIMLVRSDHRLDYYLGSRWAAELPEVVETLAIDTLRASGVWRAVHESPSPFLADYVLQINIRRFEADYTEGGAAPTIHVVLDCTLARRAGRDLISSFVAEGVAQAEENRLGAVVSAFEKAANAALTTMADRSAAAVRAEPPVAATP
ncbi:MAG TPA: ABC-type transport auxiliary lipoprotein family protein [Steroidobacteraceae bacterium]|jgi:cholesterol transport system auxiliary component|nr:ABC-type transport auxiliary lipoprotein family protein [Steroidobacteraceae bacterium]